MNAAQIGNGFSGKGSATVLTDVASSLSLPGCQDENNWRPPQDGDTLPDWIPTPPPEPQSLDQAGLTDVDAEAILLKGLMQMGNVKGADLATFTCLSRKLVGEQLNVLRDALLVSIKASAGVNDFVFQLTDAGFERAQRHARKINFTGPAPVPMASYERAIRKQSITNAKLTLRQFAAAMGDMTLRPEFISQVAQAINDGRGMFLYGSPGNGKTTLAERICDAFGQYIWIPQMINIDGDLMRLYDPSCHQLADAPQLHLTKYDRRWVLIRRPTVVVGGELTMEQLDTQYNKDAGVSEAPVQLKANGGTLLIDDFGRQRISSTDILNRLIVPLEKQFDFLNLASGRQIQTPFDLLFILSTNLEPKELVDEAFLRRIPYKIEVNDPSEEEFKALLAMLVEKMGYNIDPTAVDHLVQNHYKAANRPLRFCQPRDLLRQVKNYCEVHELPKTVTAQCLDVAVQNYFAGL